MNESENYSATRNLSPKIQLTIFSAALVARIGYLLPQIAEKKFTGADTQLYVEIASNLVGGNGFAANQGATAFVSPGFRFFLAACFEIFGANLVWASVAQCVFASLTCVFIAKIAARLFGQSVGLTAGLTAAFFYELIIWASPQLLTEPLYIFFLAPAIYYLVSFLTLEKNNLHLVVLSGMCFGLAGLVRPLAVPVAVSICLFLTIFFVSRRRRRSREIFQPVLLLSACLLVMMPWGVRNYLTMNHFTLLSLEGGHVFWLGNNPDYDKYEHPDFTKFGGYTVMFKPYPAEVSQARNEVEANQAFYAAARRHIFEHPLDFIVRGFHKTWNMWRPTFSGGSARNLLVSWTIYPLILFSALGTMFFCLKSKRFNSSKLAIYALVWIFLTHLAIHFLVTGEIRFRLPVWIVLIPFSAYFLTNIFFFLRDKIFPKPEVLNHKSG